ncbi:TPA: hypothetical protein JBJ55_06160 [Legionella pneumophila]|nr:hypothetical protein [Legionella pneumophila]
MDSKSVLNVRTLSKDHLEKIHYFLSDLEVAKKTGLVNLGLQNLIAVGKNVMHRKYGISDFYGKPKEPGSKEINKSFEKRVTLFTNETDADAHIKKHTQNSEFGYLESKPHKTVVTVKNQNTLFRIQKPIGKETDLVLSVSDKEEITKKLEFK